MRSDTVSPGDHINIYEMMEYKALFSGFMANTCDAKDSNLHVGEKRRQSSRLVLPYFEKPCTLFA